MSSQREGTFIHAIHKKLPEDVYREKMHNAYRRGCPDVFYEGREEDLWIEYKFISKFPVKELTPIDVGLSALQSRWLKRRYKNSRPVAVIVGWKEAGKYQCAIFTWPTAWDNKYVTFEYKLDPFTLQEAADWIDKKVNGVTELFA